MAETIREIQPNIRGIEYANDHDYVRVYLNLDRYELTIVSTYGNYGYKWFETKETFLHLMSRCEGDYIIGKIYGNPNLFDFEESKKAFLDMAEYEIVDSEHNEYAEYFDADEYCEPETADEFVQMLQNKWPGVFDAYDLWCCVTYVFPLDIIALRNIWDEKIVPYIRTQLLTTEESA